MSDLPLWVMITGGVVSGVVLLTILLGTFFTVDQQTVAVVERFGKFVKLANAGLNLKLPIIDGVVARMSLRIEQLDVEVETKTEDNVFVKLKVSVQHHVLAEKVYDAFYRLTNADAQIEAYVFDVVRAQVPKLKLDDVFVRKDDVADAVKLELTQVMDNFGYGIVKALVTDIEPDGSVKESMNRINAAQRLRAAAEEEGEAEKILIVKKAEAEAESKKLQGEGIANQRKAIVDGLAESVGIFQQGVEGTSPQVVIDLIIITQYFDMLESLGKTGKFGTVLLPHSPGGISDLKAQIRDATIEANATTDGGNSAVKGGPDPFGLGDATRGKTAT